MNLGMTKIFKYIDDIDANSLKELEKAAVAENVNTMPFIIKCVEVYATVGEISDVFRKVFGKYDG